MKRPKVSIIITTRNEEKNIERLLKSIVVQLNANIETIVVDNNSQDNTVAIAKKYLNKVYTKGPERSAQRNYGVAHASGKYVFILDADMELTKDVVEDCVKKIGSHGALVVPERTVGDGFMARVRKFEREMYMGDSTIEVARFFSKRVFREFGGYDVNLTGAEDYDLPRRISKKYSIGRAEKYILHHEAELTLGKQLKKKYYYASKSASYAEKHPELVKVQGILILRKAYVKNFRRFIGQPILGTSLIAVRLLETVVAVAGFISAVGWGKFFKTLYRSI